MQSNPINNQTATTIDRALAQGIRRAYLAALDSSIKCFYDMLRKDKLRHPTLHASSHKEHKKEVSRIRSIIEAAGITQHELLLGAGRRELWAAMFLVRDDDQEVDGKVIQSDSARVYVLGFTRSPTQMWLRPMSIVCSAHTIDRVIQRAGIVDLPIQPSDVAAIDIQLAEILTWAAASFFILGEQSIDNSKNMTVVLPGHYGFFLGSFETDPIEFTLRTFVDYQKAWVEQEEALALLRSVPDSQLAIYAGDVIRRRYLEISHSAYDRTILKCWREYGWRIREKADRPSKEDRAWATY